MNYDKSIQLTDWIGEKYILMGAEPAAHLKIRGRMGIRFRFYSHHSFPLKKAAVIAACLAFSLMVIFSVVDSLPYKRISFNSQTLGDDLEEYINDDTIVENLVSESFPTKFSVYKITPRKISDKEFQQMKTQLGLDANANIRRSGNTISGMMKSVTDDGYVDMTDEELEKLAWEAFNKLPFMEGTYKYTGITITDTQSDSTGTYIARVGVSFRRILDGIQIKGGDQCNLYFDNTGLVEIFIRLYDYKRIGDMDLVTLESATSRVSNPDSFAIDTKNTGRILGIVEKLQVEKCKIVYFNQYYRGCTILQPVYVFSGTATDTNGKQADFRSLVIAIPDAYTYESEEME